MKSFKKVDQKLPTGAASSQSLNPVWLYTVIAFVIVLLMLVTVSPLSKSIEHFVSDLEKTYQHWFQSQNTSNPLVLLPLAFTGGLIASISPCILALLPLNLSYIGRETSPRAGMLF